MDCTARATNWKNWTSWCERFKFNTFLDGTPKEQHAHVLMAFAARVHAGAFGHGRQIGCQSVATALSHIAQTSVLANRGDPRSDLYSPDLGLAFIRLYHSYKNKDLAPKPQLALLISVIEDVMKNEGASQSPKDQALADLVVLTFFCLLRVGEYTPRAALKDAPPKSGEMICSFGGSVHQVSWTDFLHFPRILADLLTADSVTVTLDNQKNGQRDAMLHHEALPNNPLYPCKAAVCRFVAMHQADPSNPNAILSL